MAAGPILRLPTHSPTPQTSTPDQGPQSDCTGGTTTYGFLAETPMVLNMQDMSEAPPLTLLISKEMLMQGPLFHPQPGWF